MIKVCAANRRGVVVITHGAVVVNGKIAIHTSIRAAVNRNAAIITLSDPPLL
jgi:hypothetical protein